MPDLGMFMLYDVINQQLMGAGRSKIRDVVLLEKLRRQKEEDGEEEKEGVELRRSNSLVLALEDYLHGKADQVEPILEEAPPPERLNTRSMILEKVIASVANGNYKALREEIIMHMASINRKYRSWQDDTLLHVAAQEGYARCVEFAVDPASHGASEVTEVEIDSLNAKNRTPLHLAFTPPQVTYCGRKYGVRDGKAQSEKPQGLESINDWVKPGGENERHRCIVALVQRGANLNLLDFMDWSPLHYACMLGWVDTVRFLLERGANHGQVNAVGETCLHLACKHSHEEVVQLLLETAQVDINARDSQGETPLHIAVRNDYVGIADLLLDFGADMTLENYQTMSAMKIACQNNNAEMVHLLLDFDAPRDKTVLALLTGQAKMSVLRRVDEEEKEVARIEEEKRKLLEASRKKAFGNAGKDPKGQWVPYKDKRGRGTFYYNKVTRQSQWTVPLDYVKDRSYVAKEATFGMSFYH